MQQYQTHDSTLAELRHDTVLYLKQSYTAAPVCGYPAGFVEPYPQLYARLGFLARELSLRVSKITVSYREFFENFAARMADLERLARKELAAQPFTPEEAAFLKKTIDKHGVGTGPPGPLRSKRPGRPGSSTSRRRAPRADSRGSPSRPTRVKRARSFFPAPPGAS